MKYRKTPEDFIVEEIADHKIIKNGPYKLYTLEKEAVDTFKLLDTMSRNNNIPRKDIGIAGIKDTHAISIQYLTIPSEFSLENEYNAWVNFLGYVDKPISLGDLTSNKFIITVREIDEEELTQALENSKNIKYGLPNYFDTQRFGSVSDKNFIAKYLVKKDYEAALKQYLTSYNPNDDEQLNFDKENILRTWGTFDASVKNPLLKKVVNEYKATKKWIIAYKKISPPLRELFISSYQSYLWNECVKELLRSTINNKELFEVPYIVDELIFSKYEIPTKFKTFQTISHKLIPNDYEKPIIEKVLAKQGLTIEQFNIRQSGNFFKTHERDLIMYPQNFEMDKPVRVGKKYNLTIRFTLGKGSYATLVLKLLFGK